jgi:hypothetical protein
MRGNRDTNQEGRMSDSFQSKFNPATRPTALPELQAITKKEWTPIYFAAVELVEAAGYEQDAFDVVHDAYVIMCTKSRWNPTACPLREHFLGLVRDALKADRNRRRTESRRRHNEAVVTHHYEDSVIPYVSSTSSPEDLMIAREEHEDHERWLLEKRAQIRKLQRSVSNDPVALELMDYWAEHGGAKPLTKVALILDRSLDDIYRAKKLIERHAKRIIVEKKGDDQ